MITRRSFLQAIAASSVLYNSVSKAFHSELINRISLSQWSFHRAILGNSKNDHNLFVQQLHTNPDEVLQGQLDPRDIVQLSNQLGIKTVDLVNVLFFGHAMDKPWLNDFMVRANDNNVSFQVLMCDETGALGASSKNARKLSIQAHIIWLETAAYLGCKQLRVNAYGDGAYMQQLNNCAESLSELASIAGKMNIELLVENHGHASNNGAWLAMLMEHTNHKNLGCFTDLDNFFMGGWNLKPERRYDRTQGLLDLAPYTRGVSAKSHSFNPNGRESTLDYPRYFSIFESNGFDGFYSAEYEGSGLSELAGSKATIAYSLEALQAHKQSLSI